MKIPKSYSFRGVSSKITFVKDFEDLGEYDTESKEIKLSIDLKSKPIEGKSLEWVFLHELGHKLIDTIHLDQAINGKLEEVIVSNFASLIIDLKKKNIL